MMCPEANNCQKENYEAYLSCLHSKPHDYVKGMCLEEPYIEEDDIIFMHCPACVCYDKDCIIGGFISKEEMEI